MRWWTCCGKSPHAPGLTAIPRTEYGDLEVVWIQDGRRFLDFLSGGRVAMLEAKTNGPDIYDLTAEGIECVEQMAGMVDQWRAMLGGDGSLRIYID